MAHTKIKDPNNFAKEAKNELHIIKQDFRDTIPALEDPRARALLETSAEVIDGLERAFEHYSKKSEEAWK